MKLFTHCAHREMEKDMESAHIEIERDMESAHIEIERDTEERVTYGMLLEAAILGTQMEELRRLLQDDPAILDRVMWKCRGNDNPLHVGALHGNADFVREILSRKREFTRELNSEGQSPLHLASARGHVQVVNEILSKDADACFIRDGDGMIPLHLAAINGRVEVLKVLVRAEKITAFILTKSGEPILHLCANNNKFEALKKLIELVKDDPRFVNLRDRDDNTILHLLAVMEKLEVIQFLLKTTEVDVNAENKKVVDVNAENMDGFTPLDVAPVSGTLMGGFKIHCILKGKGFKSGEKNLQSVRRLPIGKQIEGNEDSRFAEALMVVAVLTVTVAFQTRLNPPGGVWQETALHNATLPNATQPKQVLHNAGRPIMSYVNFTTYTLFAISNDITLTLSLLVIQLLLSGYLSNSTTKILNLAAGLAAGSLLCMSFTYFVWTMSISSGKLLYLSCVLVYLSGAPFVGLLLKNFFRAYV